ncbi:MAG TPA: class D sortase [Candidatus Dormibacteraeota bacterium]|nr:class D sortase [Candidatus Dormibacteraeota bacterium]
MNRTILHRFPRVPVWRTPHSKLNSSGLQLLLWVIGVVSLGYVITGYSVSAWHQAQQKANFAALASARSSDPHPVMGSSKTVVTKPAAGGLIGVLEIPRLGISSVVDEGVDNDTLLVAVGHVPGTAFPGEVGNVALAGHRDTFFRELGQLRSGDDIVVTTLGGSYRYRVEATRIVNPSANEVLDASDRPTLTLITCYPFRYIGSAPRRFIVVARQVASLDPESLP